MASGGQIEVTYYLNDVSDDLSQVLMTYDDDGVYDTAYTYGIERVGIDILDNSRPDSQNPLYYLYDGLGSVSYITKPDGEIRDTYQYDEFGKPKTGKLSPDGDKILHTSFGYTGEQWDEESKLQYLRARYYDPEVGRFINRDTYEGEVENPLSKNLYAYVVNNPVNNIDPNGHAVIPVYDKNGKLIYYKDTESGLKDVYGPPSPGSYSYTNKDGKKVTKFWTISNEEFLNNKALRKDQITAICNKKNPGLVKRGFDKAIYEASQKNKINPKVILATLAQEQGWCLRGNYKKAFGVGPGGNPKTFGNGNRGGLSIAIKVYLKWYKIGRKLEEQGKLKIKINHDGPPYRETKAVFGNQTNKWQNSHPNYVKYMERGLEIAPVNSAMYAKLYYTPWVDFPPQGSHPLDDWHKIFRSFN